MAEHTIQSAVSALSKKKDCQIAGRTISILNSRSVMKSEDLGNKSWGKIDYLVNFCGFVKEFVDSFPKQNYEVAMEEAA